jgi:hypothetical protein
MHQTLCDCLDDYLGGWLGEELRRAFEHHLDGCETCAGEVRLQQRIDGLLAVAQPAAPSGLNQAIAAAIRRRQVRTILQLAAAAALLLGVAVGGWFWRGETRPPGASPRFDLPAVTQTETDPQPPTAQQHSPTPDAEAPRIVHGGLEEAAPREELVNVNAGEAIVISEPSGDPTVHIFWVYPTVDVSFRDSTDPHVSPALERDPL